MSGGLEKIITKCTAFGKKNQSAFKVSKGIA
jgi:hypothetical protein